MESKWDKIIDICVKEIKVAGNVVLLTLIEDFASYDVLCCIDKYYYSFFFKTKGHPSCLVWLTQLNTLSCLILICLVWPPKRNFIHACYC